MFARGKPSTRFLRKHENGVANSKIMNRSTPPAAPTPPVGQDQPVSRSLLAEIEIRIDFNGGHPGPIILTNMDIEVTQGNIRAQQSAPPGNSKRAPCSSGHTQRITAVQTSTCAHKHTFTRPRETSVISFSFDDRFPVSATPVSCFGDTGFVFW